MFQLSKEEFENLRSQIVTLKRGQHIKYLPFVFTEHGILMLSSVLNSKKAIEVNIQIMRIFTQIKKLAITNTEILIRLEIIEKKLLEHSVKHKTNDQQFQVVFEAIQKMIETPVKKMDKIGFR